jgi:hypothetical protein
MSYLPWTQLLGMTRYEFKMHWRRRALLVTTLALGVCIGFMILIAGNDFRQVNLSNSSAAARQIITSGIILSIWAPIGVTLALLLPIMIADTIPLDRQTGVRELLNTLPLAPSTYLLGKLLGACAAVLAGMSILMVVSGLAWWLQVGPYDLGKYLEMWVVGVFSITVMNGGLGVLVAAGQPTRRRAISVVVGVMALFFFVLTFTPDPDSLTSLLSIIRLPIINYYIFSNTPSALAGQSVSGLSGNNLLPSVQTVALTIVAGIVELVIVGVVVWGWTRWRESRA